MEDENDPRSTLSTATTAAANVKTTLKFYVFAKHHTLFIIIIYIVGHVSIRSVTFLSGGGGGSWMAFQLFKTTLTPPLLNIYDIYMNVF